MLDCRPTRLLRIEPRQAGRNRTGCVPRRDDSVTPAANLQRAAIGSFRRRICHCLLLVLVLTTARSASAQVKNRQSRGQSKASSQESALRKQALKLQGQGRYVAAIEAVKKAMTLRMRRLKNRVPDTPQDRRWLQDLTNALQNQQKQGITADVEYRDKWFDRDLEFHDGGRMAREINKAKAAFEELRKRLGDKDSQVVAAGERLIKLVSQRRAKLDELKKLSSYRNRLYRSGKTKNAAVYSRIILKLRKQIYGEYDVTVAITAAEAARMELRTGETFGYCESLYKEAKSIYTRLHGKNHWRVRDVDVALKDLKHLRLSFPRVRKRYLLSRSRAVQCQNQINRGQFFDALRIASNEVAFLRSYASNTPLSVHASMLANKAAAYRALGRYSLSVPIQRQAIEMVTKIYGENHPETVAALNDQYTAYSFLGDQSQALSVARRSLKLCRAVWGPRHIQYAVCLTNLSEVLIEHRESRPVARSMLLAALKLAETKFKKHAGQWTNSLHQLAELDYRTLRLVQAKRLFEHVLKNRKISLGTMHPDYLYTLMRLAVVNETIGNMEQSEKQLRSALNSSKYVFGTSHRNHARILAQLARVLRKRNRNVEAELHLDRALGIMRSTLDTTFSVLSERQQLAMSRDAYQVLADYVSVAARTRQPAQNTYAHVLAWKGAIMGRQQHVRSLPTDSDSAKLVKELQETSRQLGALALSTPQPQHRDAVGKLIARLAADKERLESKLAERGAKNRSSANTLTPKQLQSILPSKTVLVDFFQYVDTVPAGGGKPWIPQRRLTAFIVHPRRAIVQVDLGLVDPIEKAGENWRRQITRGGGGIDRGLKLLPKKIEPATQPQFELRRLIWEPIEKHLDAGTLVLISTDGVLSRLPFAALPGRKPGRYLIQERPLVVVPVPQRLPHLLNGDPVDSGNAPSSLFLIGDVDFGASPGRMKTSKTNPESTSRPRAAIRVGKMTFGGLPGTRREVNKIASLHKTRFKTLTRLEVRGAAATEERFRKAAPNYRYLHIATHGFFAPRGIGSSVIFDRHPGLLSGIALAGANRGRASTDSNQVADDGILTALEVASLDLRRTELVVLSACETGLGKQANGEGLLGLQRAFQAAGAKSTITSLWKVDDAATQTLMVEFYRNLWTKKMGKLEALRQAQLSMLERYDPRGKQLRPRGLKLLNEKRKWLAPYYWAAFVLSGDWR